MAFITPRSKGDELELLGGLLVVDRIHRTLGLNIPQSEIVIGVPGYSTREDRTLLNSLLLPFRKQRDYWQMPDGTVPSDLPCRIVPRSDVPGGVMAREGLDYMPVNDIDSDYETK